MGKDLKVAYFDCEAEARQAHRQGWRDHEYDFSANDACNWDLGGLDHWCGTKRALLDEIRELWAVPDAELNLVALAHLTQIAAESHHGLDDGWIVICND